jgi:hypothetical protein
MRGLAVTLALPPSSLNPVVEECCLELRNNRPFDQNVHITPVVGAPSVSGPFISIPAAAGETDLSVDNEHLAMSAIVEPS